MTLEEKVGQMTQVDKRMLDKNEDIAEYFLGSILSGGGSVPKNNTPAKRKLSLILLIKIIRRRLKNLT